MSKDANWKRQFASDTVAGICPAALQALQTANQIGFVPSYGEDDEFTARACQRICRLFAKEESNCKIFFASSGTIANALAVTAICQSFDGVLCHPLSHLENDEANAPEYLTGGARLLSVPGEDGKIHPQRLFDCLQRGHGHHSMRPRMISVTQATEVGTVYSLGELRALVASKQELESELQKRFGNPQFRLHLHMDGARFANAVASLGCDAKELIEDVDALSLGGSKNGGPPTEAIVFFDTSLAQDFAWRVKQAGQLVSKMRYLSAPWLGLLDNDVWLANARRANAQAKKLGQCVRELGLEPVFPVEANMLFVRLAADHAAALHDLGWAFYPFQLVDGVAYRFVCNWNTSDDAVDELVQDLKKTMASVGAAGSVSSQ